MRKFSIDSVESGGVSGIAVHNDSFEPVAFSAAQPAPFVTATAGAALATAHATAAAPVTIPTESAKVHARVNQASTPGLTEWIPQYYDTTDGHYKYTGIQEIDGILSGARWTPTVLTYSFPTTTNGYQTPYPYPGLLTTFLAFDLVHKQAAKYALDLISSYTNLQFQELTGASAASANLRFSQTTASTIIAAPYGPLGHNWDGDVWTGTQPPGAPTNPVLGSDALTEILSVVGMAVGLKDIRSDWTSFNVAGSGSSNGSAAHYGSAMVPEDYRSPSWSIEDDLWTNNDGFSAPQTFMLGDIIALQYLYGINYNYNSDNTYYRFDSRDGELYINGVGQGSPATGPNNNHIVRRAVWDGGGTDTYELSAFSNDQTINLAPGAWSTFSQAMRGSAPGNIVNPVAYIVNDVLDMRSLIEQVYTGAGNDSILGNVGDNSLGGGAGNDTIYGLEGDDGINGDDGIDYVDGGDGDDSINGGDGADTLIGGIGNDDFEDGYGTSIDQLYGGIGNDTYYLHSANAVVNENASEGTDTVISFAVNYTLAANVENLTLYWYGTDTNGTGNSANNALLGTPGNNRLDGGLGADTMTGKAGNDTYVIDNIADIVVENSSEGTDTIETTLSYTLAANLENLTLAGTININGTGNDLANSLTGNAGNNSLDGGLGADTLAGGNGNDTYIVDNAADSVVEAASAGTDTVQSSVTWTLGSDVENLTLTSTGAITGTGNGLANVLTGNDGNNTLTGVDGNDSLDGGLGADTLIGGLGDDTFIIDNTSDVITETSGQGTDQAFASVTYSLSAVAGTYVEALTLTGSANINATGTSSANTLTGNSGNNVLDGRGAADVLNGGAGNDTYVVDVTGDIVNENASEGTDLVQSAVTWTLGANVENLTLTGTNAIDGTGNSLDNLMTGNTAANSLAGGAGNDTYVIDGTDTVTEAAGEGTDLVQSSVTWTLGANVENLTLTGTGAINGTGNSLANILIGNDGANSLDADAGADVLDGGLGADTMAGRGGNDTYYVDNAGDSIVEGNGDAADVVYASVSYAIAANVYIDIINLTGTADINATGNSGINTITGNSGNNLLNGGSAGDTLSGGAGNDTYVVDNAGDTVNENTGAGTDLVQSSIAWTLGSNLENLTLTGSANINGTGNGLDNLLTGNTGVNTLTGGTGNDTYVVDNAADLVVENAGEGTDTIQSSVTWTLGSDVENLTLIGSGAINATGNAGANAIIGNSGNNILDGGLGIDNLTGGTGNDTYVVDSTSDVVVEAAGGGTDTVSAAFSVDLNTSYANVENVTLAGSANLNATGNALANLLTGNSGTNTLTGGAGNDSYVIDSTDLVVESAGGGTDTITAGFTVNLTSGYANIENVILIGTGDINATGGAGTNNLTGNSGNNILDGGANADNMTGGAGNDTYVVEHSLDTITEIAGGGIDTVQAYISNYVMSAYVENLTLMGASGLAANGNTMDNVLTGNTGANTLNGGAGNDVLIGGNNADIFLFLAGSGADTINDFSGVAGDTININAYSGGTAYGGGVTITQSGANALIDLGGGNTVTVLNTTATDSNFLSHITW